MKYPRTAAALALSMAAVAAQATVVFSYGVDAEVKSLGLADVSSNRLVDTAPYSTGGARTATVDGVSASVDGWSDPGAGWLKSIAQVGISGDDPTRSGSAWVRMDVFDALRFSGPGPTAHVDFVLSYDTVFSGLGFDAFPPSPNVASAVGTEARSDRSITLSYDVPNPRYDPSAHCSFEYCPSGVYPTVEKSVSATKSLFGGTYLFPDGSTQAFGTEGDGHYTGQVRLSLDVPVDTDVVLAYHALNQVHCDNLLKCELASDASHSDHLGIEVDTGHSFTSYDGYRYEGLPAAVPEPSTLVLSLLGIAALIGVRRRHPPSA